MRKFEKFQTVYIATLGWFAFGQVLSFDNEFVIIKLPSGSEYIANKADAFDNQDEAIAVFKKLNKLR